MPADELPDFTLFSNSNSNRKLLLLCGKCLAHGHLAKDCSNNWHCKSCFKYGHKARWCLTRTQPRILWAPKHDQEPKQSGPRKQDGATQHALDVTPLDSCANPSESPRATSDSSPSPNYRVDRSPPQPCHRHCPQWRTSLAIQHLWFLRDFTSNMDGKDRREPGLLWEANHLDTTSSLPSLL